MISFMQSKILCLMLLAILASTDATTDEFLFNGFHGTDLTLNGEAVITSGGLLELTNATKEVVGHAFHPLPVSFNNISNGSPISFSTTFVFAIVPQNPDANGHGIAFALSPSKQLPGALPSSSLGLFNATDNGKSYSYIVAVELDTVQDAQYDDINDNHVGIDVDSLISKNSTPAAYVDETTNRLLSLSLISGNPMQVWIDYNGKDMRLDVTISPVNVPKPTVSLVHHIFNLSEVVADEMYVGFSAANGAATSMHYILGWSFSLNGQAQDLDLSKLPSLPALSQKLPVLMIVSLTLALVIFALIIVTISAFIIKRRNKYAEVEEDWEIEYGLHRISYKDLHEATNGFDEANVIGVGGFGRVYRGVLPKSATEVAVKKISHDSKQGMREFVSEIASMSRLRHRNLVQLLGYCRRHGELILAYEYMSNGSLDKHLFGTKLPVLSWTQRFNIIKGVAAGLLYLHEGWEQVVVHRDIKSSNVLLDGEMNGKLGDFGLARLYDHGSNPETTHIVGTIGYLAPELSKTGRATTSTDGFAFGAFLLEVACGRRPMEFHDKAEVPGLVDLVLEYWKADRIIDVIDSRMDCKRDVEEMELVLKLGLMCSHPDPNARPSMKQVVQFLEGNVQPPASLPENFTCSARLLGYIDGFDDFALSYPSTSGITTATQSSLYLSHNN